MAFIDRIQKDLTEAMKSKDELRLSVLRMVKSALKNKEIEKTREIAIIETYLPAPANEAEMNRAIEAAIAETSANSPKQMGAVIKAARARLEGKTVDGKALSDRVRDRLSRT
jgi:uncharacterized protein YqeY